MRSASSRACARKTKIYIAFPGELRGRKGEGRLAKARRGQKKVGRARGFDEWGTSRGWAKASERPAERAEGGHEQIALALGPFAQVASDAFLKRFEHSEAQGLEDNLKCPGNGSRIEPAHTSPTPPPGRRRAFGQRR